MGCYGPNVAIKYLYEKFQVSSFKKNLCHALNRENRRDMLVLFLSKCRKYLDCKAMKNAASTSEKGKNWSIHENVLTHHTNL